MAHEARISTNGMAKDFSTRIGLVQSTFDMVTLRTLLFGPAHRHHIVKNIQSTAADVLHVEQGSLYPALHRLERRGRVASKWGIAKDRNRELKYYPLTPTGRRQLIAVVPRWIRLTGAFARIMRPAGQTYRAAVTGRGTRTGTRTALGSGIGGHRTTGKCLPPEASLLRC